MLSFKQRVLQLNAPLLTEWLRRLADEIEALIPETATYLDAKGNPTSPDDVPRWASDNEAVATVAASDDGTTATVTLTGQLGAAIISSDSTNATGDDIRAQGTVTVIGARGDAAPRSRTSAPPATLSRDGGCRPARQHAPSQSRSDPRAGA